MTALHHCITSRAPLVFLVSSIYFEGKLALQLQRFLSELRRLLLIGSAVFQNVIFTIIDCIAYNVWFFFFFTDFLVYFLDFMFT